MFRQIKPATRGSKAHWPSALPILRVLPVTLAPGHLTVAFPEIGRRRERALSDVSEENRVNPGSLPN